MNTREIAVQRVNVVSSASFDDIVAHVDAKIGHPDMSKGTTPYEVRQSQLDEEASCFWYPGFYGGDPAVIGAGAIWILYAIGVGMGLALLTSRRAAGRLEAGDRTSSRKLFRAQASPFPTRKAA